MVGEGMVPPRLITAEDAAELCPSWIDHTLAAADRELARLTLGVSCFQSASVAFVVPGHDIRRVARPGSLLLPHSSGPRPDRSRAKRRLTDSQGRGHVERGSNSLMISRIAADVVESPEGSVAHLVQHRAGG